jgi:hypothetical protein
MHLGQEVPAPKRYLGIQHWTPNRDCSLETGPRNTAGASRLR